MVLGKRLVTGASTRLLAHLKTSICLPRMYASKHKPTETCATRDKKKQASAAKCVTDHPKPRDPKTIQETFPFYHLIKPSKECCEGLCPENDFAPLDKCLYKESDKNTRQYQVTWSECPPVAIKPKNICCFEKAKKPPITRRKTMDKPHTACKFQKCGTDGSDCPKVAMPGCKPVRKTVKCTEERRPSACVKVKTPYPAFSECRRAKLRKGPKTECHCLDEIPTCELNKILNRRLLKGNVSMNPCRGSS